MQRQNPFTFQRFQINGGRGGGFQGRSFSGPLAMLLAMITFILLLGATIVGAVAFLLVRSVMNLARAIGNGLSQALPSGNKPGASSRRHSGATGRSETHSETRTDNGPSPSEAWTSSQPTSSAAKTISLHKDGSGAWRSSD